MEGTYTNAAYPALRLCAASSAAADCGSVLSAFEMILGTLADDVLYATWPTARSTHVQLKRIRVSEDDCSTSDLVAQFELRPTVLYVEGYGKDTRPFLANAFQRGRAELVVDNGRVRGLGLFFFDAPDTERERLGKTVEERAEVWFIKH
jgi:hypothetical protein